MKVKIIQRESSDCNLATVDLLEFQVTGNCFVFLLTRLR